MSMAIPLGLKSAIESGNCVLFIGAGIGYDMRDENGNNIPDGIKLAQDLAAHFKISTDSDDLAKVSQIVAIRKSREELDGYIRKRLAKIQPGEHVQWLSTNRWKAIYTTNYDFGIERAYELNPAPLQTPVPISATEAMVDYDARFQVPIYHIHGALFGEKQSIVITQDDYTTFRERRRMLFESLKIHFATCTFLYIGYSHRDPNWALVWQELASEFGTNKLPVSYRIAPHTDEIDIEIQRAKGLETISCYFKDFATVAKTELHATTIAADQLQQFAKSVPKDLLSALEKNPAAVMRLLSSWEYVNQAPFDEAPNTDEFLRGDSPNWATIAGGNYFQRDIEEEVFDALLDYATSNPKGPASHVVTGPAGYGISTILMSLAVRLVTEKVGPVFYHKPGQIIREGDVEFASSLFSSVPFFIIDNAADHRNTFTKAMSGLREQKKPALILLGEQRNEWQQAKARVSGIHFPVESLSDHEINNLLDFLGRHNALKKLQPLSRELQFVAIKNTHGKELLVTMRETTEDLGFDAILENEYRGIDSDLSRRLYLVVACIFQHGAYVRDTTLASILGTDVAQMYLETKDATDGVVIFECIDPVDNVFVARTRHRTIARIVWERCGNPEQKEDILQQLITTLNLTYRIDAKAFENLIRNDHLIDSIRTFERKTQFFETACKKDPHSAYVKQHYSRMLLRADRPELALGQIEQAFAIDPKNTPKVLNHTKGLALKAMALAAESFELGRKYVARAERCFKTSVALSPRDEYAHQGLAMLFLDWAKRAENDEEAAKYTQMAESAITEGLRVAKVRDGLWIASSEIANWLGNQPSRLSALEKAVREVPDSVVARYLLARQYRMNHLPDKAKEVLQPVIVKNPDEFRAVLEYALALLEINSDAQESIAILSLSTTYGLNDPRYIATYGGLFWITGKMADAERVFKEAVARDFVGADANKVNFRPVDFQTGLPVRMMAKVVDIRYRTLILEIKDRPLIECVTLKVGGILLKKDAVVSIEIVFNSQGAVGIHPQLI